MGILKLVKAKLKYKGGNSTIDMKPKDGTTYSRMRIAQMDIGELEIHTMAYGSGNPDTPESKINFCHEIIIRDTKADVKDKGWDKIIFQGSLENLIDLVRVANQKIGDEG